METNFYKKLRETKREREYSGKEPKSIFHYQNKEHLIGEKIKFYNEDRYGNKLEFLAKKIADYQENILTGRVSDNLKKTFNRKIGQYIAGSNYIKIGITSRKPKERFEEHLKEINWKRMVVLYRTTSEDYVKELERFLIANHFDYLTNEVGGGGGDLSNGSSCYLYIITR